MAVPLMRVDQLQEALPGACELVQTQQEPGARGRWDQLRCGPGRELWTGWGVGLREDDRREAHRQADGSNCGPHHLRRWNAGPPVDVATLTGRELRAYRKHAQMIFQDPYESINPTANGVRHDCRAASGPKDRYASLERIERVTADAGDGGPQPRRGRTCSATRTSYQGARGSGSRSRGRWLWSRRSWWRTSRPRCWTRRSGRASCG